jgi:hypothetical protein
VFEKTTMHTKWELVKAVRHFHERKNETREL